MKRLFPIIVTLIAVTLVTAPRLAKAVPGNNPIYVTFETVQALITQVTGSFQSALANQNQLITALEQKVEDLETRVSVLEATPTPTPLPEMQEGIFTIDEPIDVSGYSRMQVWVDGAQLWAALMYSDDGVTWQWQSKFGEDFGGQGSYFYPIKARYYKVVSWGPERTFHYRIDQEEINAPIAEVEYYPELAAVNEPITFVNISENITAYKWEISSPYVGYRYTNSFSLTPTSTAPFEVYLTVQNDQGIVDTKTVRISFN